jgi:hypothetical protein
MKRMLKYLFPTILFLSLLYLQLSVYAAPYNGEVFETEQPDKTIIKAKAYGDEFHHRIESLDGYTLVRDPETKWICYAKLNSETSELVSTGIPYTSTSKNNNVAKIKELKIPKNLDLSADQINKKVDKIKNDRKWDEFLDQCAQNGKTMEEQTVSSTSVQFASAGSMTAYSTQTAPVTIKKVLEGNIKGLTILIDFPKSKDDFTGDYTVPKSEIENALNMVGYT